MQINLSEKKIKENIEFLSSHLPSKPTTINGLYKLPDNFLNNEISSFFYQKLLQDISDHMGSFLGIGNVKVTFLEETTDPKWVVSSSGVVSIDNNQDNSGVSGLYRVVGDDHGEILLIRKNKYELKHILAILAHEYAHHYLYRYNIRKHNENENEILTEIAAAYLGLGQLLVDGYKPIVWTSNNRDNIFFNEYTTHTMTLGYVTPETIKKAIILSAELRKWDPKEVVDSFSSIFDRIIIFLKLWPYRTEVKRLRHKKERLDAIREELKSVEEKYRRICLDFDKCSKTVSLSSISAEDGKKFVELANQIASADFLKRINICKKLLDEEDLGYIKKELDNLNDSILTWRRLLDKYN